MQKFPNDPIELYRTSNLPEAHALRLLLEEEGVAVRVDNELLQGALGELPMGWSTAPRIMVERSQIAMARQILDRFLQLRAQREEPKLFSDRCLACGASMIEFDVCPKCGWTFATEAPDDSNTEPRSDTD